MGKNKLSFGRKTAGVILGVVCLLSVAFIFYNSTFSSAESRLRIEATASLTGEIIGRDGFLYAFIVKHLSVFAHFIEFSLFGGLLGALFLTVSVSYGKTLWLGGAIGLFVALTDEFIQLFSGRVASLFDVAVDVFGFGLFYYGIFFGNLLYRKKKGVVHGHNNGR